MASAHRRLASLILVASLGAVVASVAPATAGTGADPIVKQAPPTLTAPANDKTTPVKDVVLQWTRVPYASSYEVQLSPNGDFTNNTIDLPNSGTTVATTYEVPLSLPHDEYYWRVRGVDANGHTAWSAQRQFLHDWAVPMQILQTPTATDPTIAWAPVPGASLYRVRFATEPTFNPQDSPAPLVCWTASTALTPYGLAFGTQDKITPNDCYDTADFVAGTTYYYEVVAYDDSTATTINADNAPNSGVECAQAQPECDASTIGAAGTFTWQPTAPSGTATAGPVTGLTTTWHSTSWPGTACDLGSPCPVTPTFSWNPVPGAISYSVNIYRDPYATNGYKFYTTSFPTLTPRDAYQDAQAGHAYYWTVYAYGCDPSDPTCQKTTFLGQSTTAVFAKRSDPPVLQSPAPGATVKTPWVTFSWDDYLHSGDAGSLEARNYHIQISPTQSFDKIVAETADVDMTQWTNPAVALANGVYYWRVQALDESGNQLTWSAPQQFTFDGAPPTFKLTSKDGIAITRNLHISASEADIVGTVSSQTVQVFGVASKQSVAGTWDKTGANTWTFNPSGLLVPGESYALRVSGLRDQAGNAAVATHDSVRTSTFVDDRSSVIRYSGKWSRATSSNAKRGTYAIGSSGAATVTVVGSNISVYGCKGPGFGTAVLRVDGKRQAAVQERQSFTQCGVLLWSAPVSSSRPHSLQFAQSSGSVALDAVTVG